MSRDQESSVQTFPPMWVRPGSAAHHFIFQKDRVFRYGTAIPGVIGEDFGLIFDPVAAERGLNNVNPNYRRRESAPVSATWRCPYCGGRREGDQCPGCGAARQ